MYHKIKHHLRKHTISFAHAIDGVRWAFRTQPNYRVHSTLSLLSILAGYLYGIDTFEWLIIIVLITGGFVIETINSALEQTLDCVSLERRGDIKIAKDAAAGAMLIYAIGSTIAALVILVPKIFT